METVEQEAGAARRIDDVELTALTTGRDDLVEHRSCTGQRVVLAEAGFAEQQVMKVGVLGRELEQAGHEPIETARRT